MFTHAEHGEMGPCVTPCFEGPIWVVTVYWYMACTNLLKNIQDSTEQVFQDLLNVFYWI